MTASELTATAEGGRRQAYSAWRDWGRWFFSTPRVLISGGFIVLLLAAALAAPLLSTGDPTEIRSQVRFQSPSSEHLLGTDQFGRDLFSRVLYGARLSLLVAGSSVAIGLVIGTTLGMLSGYFGNPVDTILMRVADAILGFPPILLAIFVVAFLGASLVNVIIVIGILYTPRFQRIAYGSTLAVKENDYILAARSIGATSGRILRLAILPNIIAPLLVQVSLSMGTAILLESALSFLGVGPPPSVASWGRAIQNASRFMGEHVWGILSPAIAVSLTVLAFNVFGDAIRDRLDPRLRG